VAVLGGGPAGAATVLALSHQGYSAIVIERSGYNGIRIGETLPPVVRPLLVELGVWSRFLAQKHSHSFGTRSAWGSGDLYNNDFIFNPYGSGWHLDRTRFDATLAQAAVEAGARVYREAQLMSFARSGRVWLIEIAAAGQKHRFKARVFVDATGRRAWLARRHRAKRVSYDRLVGLACFCSPACSPDRDAGLYTLIEAVEDGWWYSALLPNSQLVTLYMTDADLYAKSTKAGGHNWQRRLQQTTHTKLRVSGFQPISRPFVVAASSARIDPVVGDNWLAAGDAAATFDPLSGQGISKALHSGMSAANAIDAYFSGRKASLEDYATAVENAFANYLITRNNYYQREMRWPNSLFWRRRHSTGNAWRRKKS